MFIQLKHGIAKVYLRSVIVLLEDINRELTNNLMQVILKGPLSYG